MTDHYKILGINRNASQEDIRSAFRKLSVKFHPDKNDGDRYFANMFVQVREAYDLLSDPDKKQRYDRDYDARTTGNSGGDKSSSKYFEPVIESFTCNTDVFYTGDSVNFKWSCFNADRVELKPLGIQSIKGEKNFKIDNYLLEFYEFELTAENTTINKSVSKKIKLTNKLFSDIYNQKVKQTKLEERVIADKYKWYNESGIIYMLILYSYIFFFASVLFVPFAIYGIYKNNVFNSEKKTNLYLLEIVAVIGMFTVLTYYL